MKRAASALGFTESKARISGESLLPILLAKLAEGSHVATGLPCMGCGCGGASVGKA